MFTKYRRLAVPAHAHGKYQRDPLMVLMTIGYNALNWLDRYTSVPPMPTGTNEFFEATVEAQDHVSPDHSVMALTLVRPDRLPLPVWSPGAHIDIKLPSGLLRQYSLCGDPTDSTRYRIAVRQVNDGRGGSIEVHTNLRPGTVVNISKPRNAFPLAVGGYNQRTEAFRLIAAGIGITPILPMIRVLEQVSAQWSLIYCGRSRESTAFLNELEEFGDKVTIHFDDDCGPPTAEMLCGELAGSSAVYICGPAPVTAAVEDFVSDRADVEFHYERFSAAPVVNGREFEIAFSSSSDSVTVAADQTALSAILTARPDATYSCQQGFCRSCAVRVLNGEVDHRSTSLSQVEMDAGYFLPCVSRATGRLTVDL
ncbi:PDR/VanB family oxidoreductase [Mycobacteroides immunogenum]|uniref:Ferredoxin n=1 Tax=Mycobacteroides immunogenum TaxID=83262 RepID=A0A7V8LLZ9_9MYCO|nr:PDR/VanB family oxidoreductase [Mycobacteroides immunogenum]AMT71191.1 ferredoxin [Mycobacteroides immunogenum]ANO04298.1 ferredoxin [Mycobacteroides immunogenum]KIU38456.1 ferredoxin [Mycobacteroides immunogenum]KPG05081.1 ferredoxin [Mycobacteroides immunogenum]KPG06665.1 ferredoxin [Mycobacteroides immunogenum]